jgi:hypothetical protein
MGRYGGSPLICTAMMGVSCTSGETRAKESSCRRFSWIGPASSREDWMAEKIPRPKRKVQAAKRQCARAQLVEIWKAGKVEELPPKVRLAVETLVPELGKVGK